MSYGYNNAVGGFNMAGLMAGQQGAHLAGMINQAQNVISNENESRVAQERERRRMEHEREMLRMQAEQQERQAQLLARLQSQRQAPMLSDPMVRSYGYVKDNYGNVIDRWRS